MGHCHGPNGSVLLLLSLLLLVVASFRFMGRGLVIIIFGFARIVLFHKLHQPIYQVYSPKQIANSFVGNKVL